MTENETIKKHIEECEHRIGNILGFMVSNSDADTSICEENITVLKIAIQALEEIQQYKAIGTIEEFKALKEKDTPYKPQEYEDRYYACKCDNILLPKWRKYPTELMPKSEGLPHCMACGQKLDWQ